MADLCNRLYIQHIPQIVRAGKIHRHRFFSAVLQRTFHLLRCNGATDIGIVVLRIKPADINIQQCSGIDKGLVRIASGQYTGGLSFRHGIPGGKMQHGLDAQRRAPCGIECMSAKQCAGLCLAFGNDAGGSKQLVRPVDLRNIVRLKAQHRYALVPRHVETDGFRLRIPPDKIADGGAHSVAPNSRATATITAHSIRLRNKSQPC